jgi:hypothetical protein
MEKPILEIREGNLLIHDRIKAHFLAVKFIFLLVVANAVFRVMKMGSSPDLADMIQIATGVISLVFLFYTITKNTDHQIPLDQVDRIQNKKLWGIDRYRLVLKNGKRRPLLYPHKISSELQKLKDQLKEKGIALV